MMGSGYLVERILLSVLLDLERELHGPARPALPSPAGSVPGPGALEGRTPPPPGDVVEPP
jgi:hypothetical protein